MGGMKYLVLLALAVATINAEIYTDGCTKRCPLCLIGTEYNEPIPSDVCSYCHCDDEANQSVEKCPWKMEWSETEYACVPSTRCGSDIDPRCDPGLSQYCHPCYELDTKYPSTNPCGYCTCKDDQGGLVYQDCPPGTGWVDGKCAPTDNCCNPNECAHVECPPCYHGMNIRFPDPYNSCKFCCCEPISPNSTIEWGVEKECPDDMIFSVSENQCVWTNNRVCNVKDPCPTTPATSPIVTLPTCPPPPKPCDVTCPPQHYGENWLMPNPIDKCSFCCCKPDGSGIDIPHLKSCMEPDQFFDPTDKRCKKSNNGECPAAPLPPPPSHCRNPGDRDGCNLVIEMCKYDADGHLPNPYEDASFCQCEFDKIHWMPCAGGTTRYDDAAGACV